MRRFIAFFRRFAGQQPFGHRAGDEILKRLAHILTRNFKDVGITACTMGDEFMVILPAHRADSAFILAEEVRKVIEDSPIKLTISDRSINLRFRITGGIATYPSDGTSEPTCCAKPMKVAINHQVNIWIAKGVKKERNHHLSDICSLGRELKHPMQRL